MGGAPHSGTYSFDKVAERLRPQWMPGAEEIYSEL